MYSAAQYPSCNSPSRSSEDEAVRAIEMDEASRMDFIADEEAISSSQENDMMHAQLDFERAQDQ